MILDFGSQYTQLIARRVRELNVYCEIHPFNKIPQLDGSVKGVILSGSPYSVRDKDAPQPDLTGIKGVLPLLGVCYGAQWLAQHYGGQVEPAEFLLPVHVAHHQHVRAVGVDRHVARVADRLQYRDPVVLHREPSGAGHLAQYHHLEVGDPDMYQRIFHIFRLCRSLRKPDPTCLTMPWPIW